MGLHWSLGKDNGSKGRKEKPLKIKEWLTCVYPTTVLRVILSSDAASEGEWAFGGSSEGPSDEVEELSEADDENTDKEEVLVKPCKWKRRHYTDSE